MNTELMFSSKTDLWETPQDLFDKLNNEFQFTLDVVRQPDGSIRQQIRYVPSKFEVFAVYEPKRRMVHAPAFVDKVVLHALVDNILYDALTKSFIRDSHASQTGKGTDDGLMRLKTHMVDYYRRESHGADGWVLKGDVRHFFASIDHRKLKRKLKAVLDKRGVDPRVYELLCIYST